MESLFLFPRLLLVDISTMQLPSVRSRTVLLPRIVSKCMTAFSSRREQDQCCRLSPNDLVVLGAGHIKRKAAFEQDQL